MESDDPQNLEMYKYQVLISANGLDSDILKLIWRNKYELLLKELEKEWGLKAFSYN
jgi:hypothetical protein